MSLTPEERVSCFREQAQHHVALQQDRRKYSGESVGLDEENASIPRSGDASAGLAERTGKGQIPFRASDPKRLEAEHIRREFFGAAELEFEYAIATIDVKEQKLTISHDGKPENQIGYKR
jgi:hypothetical protein